MVSIAVIIPTTGRPSLMRTLESVATQLQPPADQMLVQWDSSGNWGGSPRNRLIPRASAEWLMFMDDDDIFLPGAIAQVRSTLETAEKVPHIFRVDRGINGLCWQDQNLSVGHVTTQGLVIPNIEGKIGVWGLRYEGDFDFIQHTVDLHGGKVAWIDLVIAKWRPEETTLPPPTTESTSELQPSQTPESLRTEG